MTRGGWWCVRQRTAAGERTLWEGDDRLEVSLDERCLDKGQAEVQAFRLLLPSRRLLAVAVAAPGQRRVRIALSRRRLLLVLLLLLVVLLWLLLVGGRGC